MATREQNLPPEPIPELVYALQRGGPWTTVRRYNAERHELSFVQKVMHKMRKTTPGKRWRIVLMPYNVLADETW